MSDETKIEFPARADRFVTLPEGYDWEYDGSGKLYLVKIGEKPKSSEK